MTLGMWKVRTFLFVLIAFAPLSLKAAEEPLKCVLALTGQRAWIDRDVCTLQTGATTQRYDLGAVQSVDTLPEDHVRFYPLLGDDSESRGIVVKRKRCFDGGTLSLYPFEAMFRLEEEVSYACCSTPTEPAISLRDIM